MRERNVEICKNLKIRELEYEFEKCIIKWIKQCINMEIQEFGKNELIN